MQYRKSQIKNNFDDKQRVFNFHLKMMKCQYISICLAFIGAPKCENFKKLNKNGLLKDSSHQVIFTEKGHLLDQLVYSARKIINTGLFSLTYTNEHKIISISV